MLAEYAKFSYARMSYSSTPVMRSSAHCLSFWYYFGGGPAGSLLAYIRTNHDVEPSLVWRRDYVPSTSRLSWLPGTISLPVAVFPIQEVNNNSYGDGIYCLLYSLTNKQMSQFSIQ